MAAPVSNINPSQQARPATSSGTIVLPLGTFGSAPIPIPKSVAAANTWNHLPVQNGGAAMLARDTRDRVPVGKRSIPEKQPDSPRPNPEVRMGAHNQQGTQAVSLTATTERLNGNVLIHQAPNPISVNRMVNQPTNAVATKVGSIGPPMIAQTENRLPVGWGHTATTLD